MAEDGKIVYKVQIDDTGIETDAQNSGKTAGTSWGSSFSDNAKIGLATAAQAAVDFMGAAMAETAAKGDAIGKGAQKISWATDAYQEWSYVLEKSGSSMSAMTNSIIGLNRAAFDGTKDQQAAFQALGLGLDEVAQMRPDQLFESVIAGLRQIENVGERTTLANALFGRGGAASLQNVLNMTDADLEGLKTRFEELGLLMSEDSIQKAMDYQDSVEDL